MESKLFVDGALKEKRKDGEKVKENRFLNSSEISEESQQKLLNAILNNNGDKFRRHVFEILTGQTVKEAQG